MTERQPVGAVTDKWKSRVRFLESEENEGKPAVKPGKSFVGGRIADAKPAAKKGELAQERKGGESAKNQSGDEEAQTESVGEKRSFQSLILRRRHGVAPISRRSRSRHIDHLELHPAH